MPTFLHEVPLRRRRRLPLLVTRALAGVALIGGAVLVGGTVASALPAPSDDPVPVRAAAAPAWAAVTRLSEELDALDAKASRAGAREQARVAAQAVHAAGPQVVAAPGNVVRPEARPAQLAALSAAEQWIDAVGSVLANPGSPRRAELSRLAKTAATQHAAAARLEVAPAGAIKGTGHLLSATR